MSNRDRTAPDVSWNELMAQTPVAVRDATPQLAWNLKDLWAIDKRPEIMSLDDLAWILDLPLWQLDGRRFVVNPRSVLASPAEFPDHFARVMAADLRYPVHVTDFNGRCVVLDGVHRVARALHAEESTISAIRVTVDELAAIAASR